jgi:hypothetical protein
VYALSRVVQLFGLVVAGSAFFVGVLDHNVRRELLLLGIGAGIFFTGHALQRSRR